MCGICGSCGSGCIETIQHMATALAHRGPDEFGFWYENSCNLHFGHRRLSIVDIDEGKQPMRTVDGNLCVVFNGEIYNHIELRRYLESRGYSFITDHSDTEVLLHGYREWGVELSNKLNGMWAFAIFDKINNVIFCSRDRFGEKPFYYSYQNNTFAFSSELFSLQQHPSIDCRLSMPALQKYFAYCFIPAPNTVFVNIFKLQAGHDLVFNVYDRSIKLREYWEYQPDPFINIPHCPEEEWGGQLKELIDRSVKNRMVADVPIGVFLSGGIDSSIISGLASKSLPPGQLKTFSIGFQNSSFDESQYADIVSKHFGTDHHCRMFSMTDTLDIIPEVLRKTDEPMGDSSNFPFYLLCSEARRKVKVVLSGDGADELFAGYDPFKALSLSYAYQKYVPRSAHSSILKIASLLPVGHKNMTFSFKMTKTLSALSRDNRYWNPIWHGSLTPEDISDLFSTKIRDEDIFSEAITYWANCSSDNIVDQTIQFYIKLYLQDRILVKSDRYSMLHGLEVRSPFLDYDLVDFVRKIPWQFKMKGNMQKHILKMAFTSLLPHEIIFRKKKGFGSPVGRWFKDRVIALPPMKGLPFINHNVVATKVKRHCSGNEDNRLFLLNVLFLTSFIDRFNLNGKERY